MFFTNLSINFYQSVQLILRIFLVIFTNFSSIFDIPAGNAFGKTVHKGGSILKRDPSTEGEGGQSTIALIFSLYT